jgi:hypothetical protein
MTRPVVPLPPTGWRPRPPSRRERNFIVARQNGLCAETGKPLERESKNVRFDHRPPIHEREWDEKLNDTIPPGADIRFIRAVNIAPDRKVTSIDVRRMGKVDRLRTSQERHAEAMQAKAAGEPAPKSRWRRRP